MANQIRDLAPTAVSLVLVVVVLGLGATVLTSIRDVQDNTVSFFGNETLTWAGNNTAMSLTVGDLTGGNSLYNNGTLINQGGNYTVTTSGTVTILNSTTLFNGTVTSWVTDALNFSYSYFSGSSARNTTTQGLIGTNTLASYVPTVALVAAAAIVIGIISMFFFRNRKL